MNQSSKSILLQSENNSAAKATAVPYNAGDETIAHEYMFDKELIKNFKTQYSKNMSWASLCIPWFGCTFAPCYIAYTHACGVQNIANEVDAQHLVLTADGIRYTVDARPTGCRFEFQHKGRVSKTIPYDMITDCDIEEPAGSSGPLCCMVKNVLSKVHVDTASSGTWRQGDDGKSWIKHELSLQGLVDPHSFKSKVWEMRRAVKAAGAETKSSNAPSSMRMSRDVGAESLELIKSQNALLRDQNALLQKIAANTAK